MLELPVAAPGNQRVAEKRQRSCTHEEGDVIIMSSDSEAESLPVDECGNPLDEFGNPQEDTPPISPKTTAAAQLAIHLRYRSATADDEVIMRVDTKRRIVIDDGTAVLVGIDHTGPGITMSPPTDNDTRSLDYSSMPNLMSDSDDSNDSIDLLNGDDGVSSDTGSSDSCAVSRKARKYVLRRAKLTALSAVEMQQSGLPHLHEHLGIADPPLTEQVPDIEAAHGSTSSSGCTGSSDGSLSDDFIDKNEPILSHLQATTLMRFFPIMCKQMIENGI
jgi:hypothetical protein